MYSHLKDLLWMLKYAADDGKWGPALGKDLAKLTKLIGSGTKTIFKKYGKSAIMGLKNGFNSIGVAFKSFGKTIGTGLKVLVV